MNPKKTVTDLRQEALEHLGALRNGGEWWLPVPEAAVLLGVPVDALHKRIASVGVGRIHGERLGDHVCIRVADVDRFAREGLPHPDWEKHEDGSIIQVPDQWLTLDRPNSPYGRTGFIALRAMSIGPHPARHVQAGDILARGEDGAVNLDSVAELPLDRGVLGLVIRQRARIDELEKQLEART